MSNIIISKLLNESYYEEIIDNGLKVIVIEKPEYRTSVCCFATPFGALDIHQKINGKEYNFHSGIAHFLEHKLFEAEETDVMNKFADMNASVNAFTSYNETVYYFSTITNDIKPTLNLLLDFVQELKINDASVEKEKGIIKQEVLMYQNMPIQRLLNETYNSLYVNYPLKHEIGGSIDDIEAIYTKELYEAYNINYHPSNMVLVVISPFKKGDILNIVKNNQKNKKFDHFNSPINNDKTEPTQVSKKYSIIKMPVNETKNCYAVKINNGYLDEKLCLKKELSLKMFFDMIFSPLNPDYQTWIDKGVINDFFGVDLEISKNHSEILFFKEKHDGEYLKKFIDENIKDIYINEEDFKILKNRYLGHCFGIYNDVENYAIDFIRNYLDGINIYEVIDIIESITINDLKNYYKELSFDNYSLISIISDKE